MMLLHDGVELPCILETQYTIEDTESFRAGVVDRRSLARDYPAVISRLVLGFPAGSAPSYVAAAGAPEPTRRRDAAHGLDTLTFEMGPVEPAAYPQTPESLAQDPHVVWSTFKDWSGLARDLDERLTTAATLDDDARRSLSDRLDGATADAEKARLVAEFVKDSTRYVNYPSTWWPAPRSAQRTWETAYADRVDRTVLAAALYREAGLEATLAFRGAAFGEAEIGAPNLSWTDGPGLWIEGDGVEGCFDPVKARFSAGPTPFFRRAIWRPASDPAPAVRWGDAETPSRLAMRIDLDYDAEGEHWTGTGTLTATGALCPYPRMSGLADEAQAQLEHLAGGLLGAVEVTGYSPATFSPSQVVIGFAVDLPEGERDALDRLHLVLGDPEALAPLLEHASIHVYEESRDSGVVFPTPIEQRLELRFDPADLEVVYLPPASRTANAAGSCVVATSTAEDKVVLSRTLALDQAEYAPDAWPDLRSLLLADGQEGNHLILLK
jgi:hypothetical protein